MPAAHIYEMCLIPGGRKGRQGPSKPEDTDATEVILLTDSDEAESSHCWPKNSASPWCKVEQYWCESSNRRRKIVLQGNESATDYLNTYPTFEEEAAHTLAIYLRNGSWSSLIPFAPYCRMACVGNLSDRKMFKVATATRQNAAITHWRPNRKEMRNAFLMHVKVIGDLETKLNERIPRLSTFNCKLQQLQSS